MKEILGTVLLIFNRTEANSCVIWKLKIKLISIGSPMAYSVIIWHFKNEKSV